MLNKWKSLSQVPNRSHILSNAKSLLSMKIRQNIEKTYTKDAYSFPQSHIRWLGWVAISNGIQLLIRDAINAR